MDEQLKSNLTSSTHWLRFLYMVFFAFALYLASFVAAVLIVVQFVFTLVTAAPNTKLRTFGYCLVTYIQQCFMFLTYNSENKPFPFADWPQAPEDLVAQEQEVPQPSEPTSAESTEEVKQAEDFHNAKTQVLNAVSEEQVQSADSASADEATAIAEAETVSETVPETAESTAEETSEKVSSDEPAEEKSETTEVKKKPASKKSKTKTEDAPADEEENEKGA